MTRVLIKVSVACPADFLGILDEQAVVRRQHGEVGLTSWVNDDVNDEVHVLLGWESVRSATEFWESALATYQASQWGSAVSPEITVMRDDRKVLR